MDFANILQKMREVIIMEKNIGKRYAMQGYQHLGMEIYTHNYRLSIEHDCHPHNPQYRVLLADYRSEPVQHYSCTLEEVAQAIMAIGVLSPLEPETLETLVTSNQDGLGVKI